MIAFEINFGGLKGTQRIPKKRVESLFVVAENLLKLRGDRETSIAFVDKKEMTHLNETYYGGKGVTDVLSFSSEEPHAKKGYLGEILIHYPRAQKQAKERGASARSEVEVLIVHGLLHLLGYDHDTPTKKSKMFRLQDRILESK